MKLAIASSVLVVALVLVSVAAADAASPRMSSSDRAEIGAVLDEFVKDAVLRRNLAEAWALAGPGLRGGTTRASWVKGRGLTVPYYPARGTDFRNAWTGTLASPTKAELTMIAHPRPGSKGFPETAFAIEMRKIDGRWVVNSFYSDAEFGKNGVIGSGDFRVFHFDRDYSGYYNAGSRRHWLYIVAASVGAALLLIPLGIFARVKRRDRWAWAAYSRHR